MTTINASFVYDNDQAYVELAQDVNALNKTSNNSLQIPVNLKHLYKEHYIELIERNLAVYQSHLDSPLTEVLFSVIIDDAMLGNVGSDINYSVLHERTKKLRSKGYGFDFVSHQGLKDLHVESVRKDFIRAMRKFNAGFANLGQETSSMRRFGTLKDFRESMELVFHEGDLYVRPTMSERPNIFHEQMLYTGPWNALDLLTHSMMRFNRNLEIGSSLHDCHDCMRITDCSKRFVHDVMSILKTEECLISLKKVLQPA